MSTVRSTVNIFLCYRNRFKCDIGVSNEIGKFAVFNVFVGLCLW